MKRMNRTVIQAQQAQAQAQQAQLQAQMLANAAAPPQRRDDDDESGAIKFPKIKSSTIANGAHALGSLVSAGTSIAKYVLFHLRAPRIGMADAWTKALLSKLNRPNFWLNSRQHSPKLRPRPLFPNAGMTTNPERSRSPRSPLSQSRMVPRPSNMLSLQEPVSLSRSSPDRN